MIKSFKNDYYMSLMKGTQQYNIGRRSNVLMSSVFQEYSKVLIWASLSFTMATFNYPGIPEGLYSLNKLRRAVVKYHLHWWLYAVDEDLTKLLQLRLRLTLSAFI